VISYGHPADWLSVSEARWDEERAAAAQHRMARMSGARGQYPGAVRRALQHIEHMYYMLTEQRRSVPIVAPKEEAKSDAELTRLLTLLTPDGDVLRVERVRHGVPTSEEETCASGF
jgi:hypothetical protein